VFSCGSDSDGQLGVGFGDLKQLSPVPVTSLTGVEIAKLIAGETHVVALTASGDVYTWGAGSQGQVALLLCFTSLSLDGVGVLSGC
jgi:alpha-tubulin suppressor-like RCC1 family protein